jgi:hypothetical protein
VGSLAVRCDEGADRRQVRGGLIPAWLGTRIYPDCIAFLPLGKLHRQEICFGRNKKRLLHYAKNLPVSFSNCDAGPNRDTRR